MNGFNFSTCAGDVNTKSMASIEVYFISQKETHDTKL